MKRVKWWYKGTVRERKEDEREAAARIERERLAERLERVKVLWARLG